MPAKKTATKKVARKRGKAKATTVAQDPGVFDILTGNFGDTMQELFIEAASKRGSRLTDPSLDDGTKSLDIDYIRNRQSHIPDFPIQYLINSWGLRRGIMVDLIGVEGVGKTSLCFTLAGRIAKYSGGPSLYLETEGKPLDENRILRCLSTNIDEAYNIRRNAVQVKQGVYSLQEAYVVILTYIRLARKHVPRNIPIAIFLDTFSKLMSNYEADAHKVVDEVPDIKPTVAKKAAKKVAKKKAKTSAELEGLEDVNDSKAGFQHAKVAHRWTRVLPKILNRYNAFMVFVRHQNDKVDMGGASFGPLPITMNVTSIGGRGIPQSAALQLLITKMGMIDRQVGGENKKVGAECMITVKKNTHGPGERKMSYVVNWENLMDSPTYQTPAISFAFPFCQWLAKRGYFGVRAINRFEYSSSLLGVESVSPEILYSLIHKREDLITQMGDIEGIVGIANPRRAFDLLKQAQQEQKDAEQASGTGATGPDDDTVEPPIDSDVGDIDAGDEEPPR